MKRLIPLAILSITMALPTFLTSCNSDDELLPDTRSTEANNHELDRALAYPRFWN